MQRSHFPHVKISLTAGVMSMEAGVTGGNVFLVFFSTLPTPRATNGGVSTLCNKNWILLTETWQTQVCLKHVDQWSHLQCLYESQSVVSHTSAEIAQPQLSFICTTLWFTAFRQWDTLLQAQVRECKLKEDWQDSSAEGLNYSAGKSL